MVVCTFVSILEGTCISLCGERKKKKNIQNSFSRFTLLKSVSDSTEPTRFATTKLIVRGHTKDMYTIATRTSRSPPNTGGGGFICGTLRRPLAGTRSLRGPIKEGDLVGLIYEASEASTVMSTAAHCYLIDDFEFNAAKDAVPCPYTHAEEHLFRVVGILKGKEEEEDGTVAEDRYLLREVFFEEDDVGAAGGGKEGKVIHKQASSEVFHPTTVDSASLSFGDLRDDYCRGDAAKVALPRQAKELLDCSYASPSEFDFILTSSIENINGKMKKNARDKWLSFLEVKGRAVVEIDGERDEEKIKKVEAFLRANASALAEGLGVTLVSVDRATLPWRKDYGASDGGASAGGTSTPTTYSVDQHFGMVDEAAALKEAVLAALGPTVELSIQHTANISPRLAPPLLPTRGATDVEVEVVGADGVCSKVTHTGVVTAAFGDIFRIYCRNDPCLRYVAVPDVTNWSGVVIDNDVRKAFTAGNTLRFILARRGTDVEEENNSGEAEEEDEESVDRSDEEEEEGSGNSDEIEDTSSYNEPDADENNMPLYCAACPSLYHAAVYGVVLRVLPPLTPLTSAEKSDGSAAQPCPHSSSPLLLCQLYNIYLSKYEDIVLPIPADCVSEVPMEWAGNEDLVSFNRESGEGYALTGLRRSAEEAFVAFDARAVDVFANVSAGGDATA